MSADTRALLHYEAKKKSTFLAYVLWLFFSNIGAHRFYAGANTSGAVMLMMTIAAVVCIGAAGVVGYIFFVPLWVWSLVDLFKIPGLIRRANIALADQLS